MADEVKHEQVIKMEMVLAYPIKEKKKPKKKGLDSGEQYGEIWIFYISVL